MSNEYAAKTTLKALKAIDAKAKEDPEIIFLSAMLSQLTRLADAAERIAFTLEGEHVRNRS